MLLAMDQLKVIPMLQNDIFCLGQNGICVFFLLPIEGIYLHFILFCSAYGNCNNVIRFFQVFGVIKNTVHCVIPGMILFFRFMLLNRTFAFNNQYGVVVVAKRNNVFRPRLSFASLGFVVNGTKLRLSPSLFLEMFYFIDG